MENKLNKKINQIWDMYDKYDSVDIVTDYDCAKYLLKKSYEVFVDGIVDGNIEYCSIDFNTENDLYLISFDRNSCFIIEPLLRHGQYYEIESQNLVIDGDIIDKLSKDFHSHIHANHTMILTNEDNEVAAEQVLDDVIMDRLSKDFHSYVVSKKEVSNDKSESEILLGDFINEKALLFEDLKCDVKSILKDIYNMGFQSGKNEMGLQIDKLLNKEMDI